MPRSPVRTTFDADYYERFYGDPATRAATANDATRHARFIAAYLKFLELRVARILDLGCGLGRTLRALGREYPRATTTGVEVSEYLCEKYGWARGTVGGYRSGKPFDLVVCHDVVQYLDDEEAALGLANLGRLCRGALVFGVLTTEDWRENCDRSRTDGDVHLRDTRWYRRRLARWFVNVGGGLYLKRPVDVAVWSLDRIG